jgi:copper chaperone NosL
MNKLFIYFTLTGLLLLTGCKVEPEPINYGKDQCHFCKMNIVDKQHAAQMVTQKGKQYKYDAIECMINELNKTGNIDDIAIFLISDYGLGEMTDAKTATYLISDKIKSPMGANLSGFSTKERAEKFQKESGGELYSWEEILVKIPEQE